VRERAIATLRVRYSRLFVISSALRRFLGKSTDGQLVFFFFRHLRTNICGLTMCERRAPTSAIAELKNLRTRAIHEKPEKSFFLPALVVSDWSGDGAIPSTFAAVVIRHDTTVVKTRSITYVRATTIWPGENITTSKLSSIVHLLEAGELLSW